MTAAATVVGEPTAELRLRLKEAPDAQGRTTLIRERLRSDRSPLHLPAGPDGPVDLQGVSLPRARLRRADLSGADLREADLSGAFLAQSHLHAVQLDRANLRGADLSHARCSGARLGEADLQEALLEEADLQGATLRFCDLRGAALEAAALADADLWGAKLDGADLRGAGLQRAMVREAAAREADFSRADLKGAVMTNTDLSGARFTGADLREAQLQGARLDGADLSAAALQDLDLSQCTLKGARWNGAKLDRTGFDQAQLGEKVGEEIAGEWSAAAGAYLALERNFAELGEADASSWAYRRRRRMQKRAAGAAAGADMRRGAAPQALAHALTYVGDTAVEWSCDYGESVGRVFATLLLTYFGFMALYALSGAIIHVEGGRWSVSRRLVDLAVFSMEAMTNTQASNNELKPSHDFAVFMSGAETLISIFLTGLLGFVAGNRIRR